MWAFVCFCVFLCVPVCFQSDTEIFAIKFGVWRWVCAFRSSFIHKILYSVFSSITRSVNPCTARHFLYPFFLARYWENINMLTGCFFFQFFLWLVSVVWDVLNCQFSEHFVVVSCFTGQKYLEIRTIGKRKSASCIDARNLSKPSNELIDRWVWYIKKFVQEGRSHVAKKPPQIFTSSGFQPSATPTAAQFMCAHAPSSASN